MDSESKVMIPSAAALQAEILEVFAEVTRYPKEILDPEASLEEDLGIDSVKLGEIFSVLREKYHLPAPENFKIPRENLKTIHGLSEALHQYLAGGMQDTVLSPQEVHEKTFHEQPSVPVHKAIASAFLQDHDLSDLEEALEKISLEEQQANIGQPLPLQQEVPAFVSKSSETVTFQGAAPGGKAPSAVALQAEIVEIFAEVTRYPKEILDPEASLEEDLGIDSVKLGEIFSVLREKYHLPAPENFKIPRESLRTIHGVADALHQYLSSVAAVHPGLENTPVIHEDMHFVAHKGNGSSHAPDHPVVADEIIRESFAYLRPEARPFKGKIGFISGSGRGLGKDIAMYLADLGATVVINSFHSRQLGKETEQEIKERGGDVQHIWGSMANPEHLHAMFDEIEARYGALDFFISNASNGMLAPIEKLEVDHWQKAFMTNVVGLQQGAVRAVQLMKKRGGGKIITLSSPAAHGYVEYFGCMGAVKAAVESLTRAMAIEFARYNIQVNCVSPGPLYGALINKWPESQRLVQEWEKATPYERLCNGKDVAHFIAYLLSDAVKLFTGSILVIDGGISSKGW